MNDLDQAIAHNLSAAIGWLELGNAREALAELEKVPAEFRHIPAVLELRWMLHSTESDWEHALEIAEELLETAPDEPSNWLHYAYALRRASGGGLEAAWDALSPALGKFPSEPAIAYNLACYACRLGRTQAARDLLARSFQTSRKSSLKKMALADSDLEELWDEIKSWE